ncbi:hypothetical protein O1611_g10260 [Lasiodiplodia mahajangana]|uniref:Uncharacterized protein n=1 Tax=Lasiodiplodia mahajangana TaxID=1108764 RepID=A0ACC2J0D6_9PEZI|nr:hypothetical protein O1611_g10260 [Lasiodiplodia mahajangana]
MIRPPVTRRLIVVTTISFIAVSSLIYHYFFGSRNAPVATFGRHEFAPCAIWPDSPTSRLDFHGYEDCHVALRTPYIGDQSVLGNPEKCLRASSRLDPYRPSAKGNWSEVKWGQVQSRCASGKSEPSPHEKAMHQQWRLPTDSDNKVHGFHRAGREVAIVLRTWDDYIYTDNRMAWLRALIAEASLERRNKYRVFFLVHIKDPWARLEEDGFEYDRLMRECVPSEFHDIAFLFNQRTLQTWYPRVSEHG